MNIKIALLVGLFGFACLNSMSAQSLPSGVPVSGFDVYSTSEVITNKVWIDGKLIYRKVVSLGALPSSAIKTVSHGLSGVTFTSVTGVMYASGAYTMNLPFGYPVDANGYSVGLQASSTVVEIRTGNSVYYSSGYVAYAILEYTKS